MIPIDSIVVPKRFVDLCHGWAGSVDCKLRAISSTGNLTIGTRRPRGCDYDDQWYLTIWRDLAGDLDRLVSLVVHTGCDDDNDLAELIEFGVWVDEQVDRLERSYGLADWDGCDN